MNASNYPDTMTTTQPHEPAARSLSLFTYWLYAAAGAAMAWCFIGLGAPLWAVLAAALGFLIVSGVVGTRREQRRRGARIEAALSARRRASAG